MKKITAYMLALSLVFGTAAFGLAETAADEGKNPADTGESEKVYQSGENAEEAEDLAGEWYGLAGGLEMKLNLRPDGSYILLFAGEDKGGVWQAENGAVLLDGGEGGCLPETDEGLLWGSEVLSRERAGDGDYIPADVLTDGVAPDLFNGYWTSLYVVTDGVAVPSGELNDRTDLYIEDGKAVLGGDLFGDTVVDLSFADGALAFASDEVKLTLQIQEDGLMRLILSGAAEGDLVIYLLPEVTDEEPGD